MAPLFRKSEKKVAEEAAVQAEIARVCAWIRARAALSGSCSNELCR